MKCHPSLGKHTSDINGLLTSSGIVFQSKFRRSDSRIFSFRSAVNLSAISAYALGAEQRQIAEKMWHS
jgi:hypothetical protein